jgi:hypothetical protein
MMKSPTVSDITLSLKTIEAATVEGMVAGPSRRSSYACFACRKSRSAVLQAEGNCQVEGEVGEFNGACIKHPSPIASVSDPSPPEAPILSKGYRIFPGHHQLRDVAELPRSAESAWSRRRWVARSIEGRGIALATAA